MKSHDVVIVGGGQAGLAVSHELTATGIEHVVLERGRIAESWRRLWDTFCLVTPNWTVRLPGYPYDGADPDGFMLRDEIVAYLERYARHFVAPVEEGVTVESVRKTADGGEFLLGTSSGTLRAATLVLAAGAFQRSNRPAAAATLPAGLLRIDVRNYRNPSALPPGKVLIIGSGQSGAQIAEELYEAGRDVYLSCGRAPWVPRRLGGRDIVWWLLESGMFDQSLESVGLAARLVSNPLASGHGGGHDLTLRTLQTMGVTLLGHFTGAVGGKATFAGDLAESVAWGDARYAEIMVACRKMAAERSLPNPEAVQPAPFVADAPTELDLAGFGAVLFAGGFRPDYPSWVPWPDAFDELGFPLQRDGESTAVPGLYFIGVHFLRTRKSALLGGVGDDATIVAQRIAEARQLPGR